MARVYAESENKRSPISNDAGSNATGCPVATSAGLPIEFDEVGLSTLEHLNAADRLNRWIFATIRPHVSGEVLEIGSGIGNISACCIQGGIPLSVSDFNEHYCQLLREKFTGNPFVKNVFRIDLGDKAFKTSHASILGSFDTVFALNVVEHIADDSLAMANCHSLLASGGSLIILVPAHQWLFNDWIVNWDTTGVTRAFPLQSCYRTILRMLKPGILIWQESLAGSYPGLFSGGKNCPEALSISSTNLCH